MGATRMRLLICLVAGIAFAGRLEAAGVPALEPVPQDLPEDVRAALANRQAQLRQELADLSRRNREFAAKYAGGVVEGSPEDAAARREQAALEAEKARYVEAANKFNEDVRQAARRTERRSIPVGAAGEVRGTVEWITSRGAVPVRPNTPIFLGGRYKTGAGSRLRIRLADGTVFTMGPESDMEIDESVYDPNTDARAKLVRVLNGIFRCITGKVVGQYRSRMKVKLARLAVAFRGTDVIMEAREDKSAEVTVLDGLVDVSLDRGGPPVTVKAGQRLLVKGERTSVEEADARGAERDWLKRVEDGPAGEAPPPHKAR